MIIAPYLHIRSNITSPYVLTSFRYDPRMVGEPKTSQDLRKVEGAVRLTCRACRKVTILDREEMILMRNVGRKPCDWPTVVHEMTCPNCSSANVKVQIEAFGEGVPELRRRRAVMITLELAVKILTRGAYSGSTASVPIEAVRLALRAIHPHLGNRALLERYWAAFVQKERRPWESPAGALGDIIGGLLKRGYALPSEMRMGR